MQVVCPALDGHWLTLACAGAYLPPPQATSAKKEFERCLLTRSTDPKRSLEIIKREQDRAAAWKYDTTGVGFLRAEEYNRTREPGGDRVTLRAALMEHGVVTAWALLASKYPLGLYLDYTSQLLDPLYKGEPVPHLLTVSSAIITDPGAICDVPEGKSAR